MALNIVERIDMRIRVRRVLLSVSNKHGIDRLARGLVETLDGQVKLMSTGGTYDALRKALSGTDAEHCLMPVSNYTGQPEMQGGLVKTLDFKLYLGLLSETYNPAHQSDLNRLDAAPIDLVVVNLYPFRETVAQPDVTPENARTNIDIGGPCMLRAAAKNYLRVAVVTDPDDYDALLDALRRGDGHLDFDLRFKLMQKAFRHTAEYDAAIAAWFGSRHASEARFLYTDGAGDQSL